ncbi:MAG: hypothetical protein LBQ06_00175 [Frankiaceae bacterium]|jgi:hypothetical protein|nr:hypothetical protein [Frankiaceae bacterium]
MRGVATMTDQPDDEVMLTPEVEDEAGVRLDVEGMGPDPDDPGDEAVDALWRAGPPRGGSRCPAT